MTHRFKILLVDDEPNNLKLLQQILKTTYQLMFATNGDKAISAAIDQVPDLILLDIMMPGLTGYEVCSKLKANPKTRDIPVIFVTAMGELEDEAAGFDVGAVDYIQKPVSGAIVLRRVQTHISLVRSDKLKDLAISTIQMLGEAGHHHDADTGDHIWRMAAYSSAIAKAAGWSSHRAEYLEFAASMHDTGKIGIPSEILQAPRKLTKKEWDIMKTHSQIGYDILCKSKNEIFIMAADVALAHHERWDGTGYPNQQSGTDIPECARIVAIADVFDALTVKRPYKEAWTVTEAMAEITKSAGNHLDPTLVDLFISIKDEIQEIRIQWLVRESNAA